MLAKLNTQMAWSMSWNFNKGNSGSNPKSAGSLPPDFAHNLPMLHAANCTWSNQIEFIMPSYSQSQSNPACQVHVKILCNRQNKLKETVGGGKWPKSDLIGVRWSDCRGGHSGNKHYKPLLMGIEPIPIFKWETIGTDGNRFPWIPIFHDGNLLNSHEKWLVVKWLGLDSSLGHVCFCCILSGLVCSPWMKMQLDVNMSPPANLNPCDLWPWPMWPLNLTHVALNQGTPLTYINPISLWIIFSTFGLV